jgi:hypothetical protein
MIADGLHIKERYSDLVDHSPNDICRYIGLSGCDSDMEFYDKDFKTLCIVDFKHNGFGNAVINLKEKSLIYQKQKAAQLGAAFFVLITYTKAGEQEHPMFFAVPMNRLAVNKLKSFYRVDRFNIRHLWLTPREWSRFIYQLSGMDIDDRIRQLHDKQSDVLVRYQLPKIVCSNFAANCKCYFCQLKEKNNDLLDRLPDPQLYPSL